MSVSTAYPTFPPQSTYGYQTNNRWPSFPPLMSDGRSVSSSWQPESTLNDNIVKENNIKSNWEYRKFLRANANQIMAHNFKEACNDTGYSVPRDQNMRSVVTPYLYKSYFDNTQVLQGDSDLKQLYLSREQLEARKVAPTVSINNSDFLPKNFEDSTANRK
jgi:hypothetical protein